MRALLIVLMLLSSAVQAASTAQLVGEAVVAQVVDCGRYRILDRESRPGANTSAVGFSSVIKTELLEASTEVPIRLGEAFGFRYRLQTDETAGEWLPLQIAIHHPPLIDVHGRQSEGFVIDSAARRDADGSYRNGAFYVLSDQRELVAGRWRIDLIHAGRTLISREFHLVPADGRVAGTQLAEPEVWQQ